MPEEITLTRRLVADATTPRVLALEVVRRHLRTLAPWRNAVVTLVVVVAVLVVRERRPTTTFEHVVHLVVAVAYGMVVASLFVAVEAATVYRRSMSIYRSETPPGVLLELGFGRTAFRCRELGIEYTRDYATLVSAERHGGAVAFTGLESDGLVFDGRLVTDADLATVRYGIRASAALPPPAVGDAWSVAASDVPLTATLVVTPDLGRRMESAMLSSWLRDPLLWRGSAVSVAAFSYLGWIFWPHDSAVRAVGAVVVGVVGGGLGVLLGGVGFVRRIRRMSERLAPGSAYALGVGVEAIRTRTTQHDHMIRYSTVSRVDVRRDAVVVRTTARAYHALPAELLSDSDLQTLRDGVARATGRGAAAGAQAFDTGLS